MATETLCFTGMIADDKRLSHIRMVLHTPRGYGFEIINSPVSAEQVDLSGVCIENIYDLLSFCQGDYEVILTAADSRGQKSTRVLEFYLPVFTACRQDRPGGQCVNYVREFFGGRIDLMPGLCIYGDCGAYHAWEIWDLGFGKGRLPAEQSILVLDRDPLEYGHVAVVQHWKRLRNGTYELIVSESNWDQDELIDCHIRYTYFPDSATAVREGRDRVYRVAGFIYSKKNAMAKTGHDSCREKDL